MSVIYKEKKTKDFGLSSRGARVPAPSGGVPVTPRDHGPSLGPGAGAGEARVAPRERQRGREHVPDSHGVHQSHFCLAAAFLAPPAAQVLLPHCEGDALLLRRAGRRADGRVRADRAGRSHP